MERDIYKSLHEWKTSRRRKPLILNGARQVGKTYSLKHFGKTHFKQYAYFNFEKDQKLAQYFEGNLDPKNIIRWLSIYSNIEINPDDTLIIFDEIQQAPKALNCLKYFCEETPEYFIATAGSLLGVKTAKDEGFPVGKVNFLNLYPLNFFEFLSALGEEQLRQYLEAQQQFEPLPLPFHDKLIGYLKLYFFVGGMPEAVSEYIQSGKLQEVRTIQLEILNAYEKDFAKHARSSDIMKITTVWHQIHQQLAKENKKFIFSAIRKSARGRDYEDAIRWLIDAGLIHKSYLVESPKFPLSAYADQNIFKIFLLDVGLLGAQSHLSASVILEGNDLFLEFKGSLTENFVAQELISHKSQKLYYWESSGTAEVDFLIEDGHEIYPLEIKFGTSNKKKSLHVFQGKYHPKKLIRSSLLNFKHDGDLYNYPLYLLAKLL